KGPSVVEERLGIEGVDAATVPDLDLLAVTTDLNIGVLVGDAVFGLEFFFGVVIGNDQGDAGLDFRPTAPEGDHGRPTGRTPFGVEIEDGRLALGDGLELVDGFEIDRVGFLARLRHSGQRQRRESKGRTGQKRASADHRKTRLEPAMAIGWQIRFTLSRLAYPFDSTI